MTNREFYVAVSSLENVPAKLTEKANELIAKLDASNAKRTSADSKQKKEVAERRTTVLSALTDEFTTADAIAELCGLTVGQVRNALSSFVAGGIVEKKEIKTNKNRRMVYKKVTE